MIWKEGIYFFGFLKALESLVLSMQTPKKQGLNFSSIPTASPSQLAQYVPLKEFCDWEVL
jgi:hypothetical protein